MSYRLQTYVTQLADLVKYLYYLGLGYAYSYISEDTAFKAYKHQCLLCMYIIINMLQNTVRFVIILPVIITYIRHASKHYILKYYIYMS